MIKKIIIGAVIIALAASAYVMSGRLFGESTNVVNIPPLEKTSTQSESEEEVVEEEIQMLEEESISLDAEIEALADLDFE